MAEAKFTSRPQIQVGDVVRVSYYGVTRCFVVFDVDIDGVYVDSGARVFSPEQIISIYRLGGRDLELIWRDEEYYRRIWAEACATASKAAKDFAEAMKSVTEALEKMEQYAKEAEDGKHGSEKAD